MGFSSSEALIPFSFQLMLSQSASEMFVSPYYEGKTTSCVLRLLTLLCGTSICGAPVICARPGWESVP